MSIFVEGKETFLLGLQRLHGRNKERRGSKECICKDLVETLEKENIDYTDFGRTGRNLEQKNRNNRRGGNPKHKTSLKRVNRH